MDAGVELYEDVAAEKEIVIEKQFGGPIVIPADAPRIRQVFANLLDNALKYTARGGRIVISGLLEPGQALWSVSRTTVRASRQRICRASGDRLYRADKSRAEHGLGLGLSLVKAIVEAHGGRVQVAGMPGTGSEFRVLLPIHPLTREGETARQAGIKGTVR